MEAINGFAHDSIKGRKAQGMLNQLKSVRESAGRAMPGLPFKNFRIVLIKPSKYDDDGYVIRFWKGVLPSNTLNVLHGLTEEVKSSRVFGDLSIEIITFDETAEKLPVKKIIRWASRPSTSLWSDWWESKPISFHGPSTWLASSGLLGSM